MKSMVTLLGFLTMVLLLPAPAQAHCDTLGGPVIQDARVALDKGDITPVLKWIKAADEPEARSVLQKVLAVRAKDNDARDIADRYFFETLVRLHRAGEGAPFAGLKEQTPEPVLVMADEALDAGSAEELTKDVTAHVAAELRHRFAAAEEAHQRAGDSVSAGREYVARYVELMHYLERLHGEEASPHK